MSVSKKNSFILLTIFSFALLALLAHEGNAWAAKKRIVVTRFAGKGDYAQRTTTEVVARDAAVISDAVWIRAMKKLKLKSTSTPDATIRVAAAVKADGIVSGSVQRIGKAWSLTITVVDGKTGQVSDTLEVPLRSFRIDGDAKKAIAAQLAPALAKLGGGGQAAPLEIAPDTRAPPPPPRLPDVDTEKAPIGIAPPPVETTAETPAASASSAPVDDGRYSRSRAAEITLGFGIVGRNLAFDSASSLTGAQAPRGYSGSVVPTILVEGELYPFALNGQTSALAGLGVAVELERAISITSKLGDTEYDTAQTRYGGGLRYRFNLGSTALGPTVKILAGINQLRFTVNRGSADLAFPDVVYTYIDVGAQGRMPLGSPKIALYLGLRYLQVLGSGEINDPGFYGSGGALGFDGEVGLEYIFARRGMIRLGGRYQRFSLSFDGNGSLSNNRDGNPATQEVSGATDQFYGGYLTVGYLF